MIITLYSVLHIYKVYTIDWSDTSKCNYGVGVRSNTEIEYSSQWVI